MLILTLILRCPYSETDDSGDELQNILDSDQAYDNGVLYPPEHYLAEASQLDVSRLRQQRYSPKTLKRLEEARGYWDR